MWYWNFRFNLNKVDFPFGKLFAIAKTMIDHFKMYFPVLIYLAYFDLLIR